MKIIKAVSLLLAAFTVLCFSACSKTDATTVDEKASILDFEYGAIITVKVVTSDGTEPFEITTEDTEIGDALKKIATVKDGKITAVNGTEGEWILTKGGASAILTDKISDGETYELTLK